MKNKKVGFPIVLSGLVLLILMVGSIMLLPHETVNARRANQAATPTPPNAAWAGTFVVRGDLPFVWLREAPLSSAASTATAYPNQTLTASVALDGRTQVWDGTQWWGYVNVPGVAVSGWIELTALQAAPTPTPTPTMAPQAVAGWGNSTAVRVRATLAYAWLRQKPSSDAIVLFQVPAGSVMVTIAKPQSDNVQNWWPVLDVQSGVMGWIEQNSLEPASAGIDIATATLEPVPPAQGWQPGNKVRVRNEVTVGLVQMAPNSRAQTLARVAPGNILDLIGTPLFGDGNWWWLVKTRGTNITGWIEQSVLDIAPSDA